MRNRNCGIKIVGTPIAKTDLRKGEFGIAESHLRKQNCGKDSEKATFGKMGIPHPTSHMQESGFRTAETKIVQHCQKGGKFSRLLNLELR